MRRLLPLLLLLLLCYSPLWAVETSWVHPTIPDCQDAGGAHLNYTASTNTFSCGSSGSGAGGGDITAVGDGCATGACFTTASPSASLVFNNATSGTVKLQTVTGALGTRVQNLPAKDGDVAISTGTLTSGNCAKFDASGRIVDNGSACNAASGLADSGANGVVVRTALGVTTARTLTGTTAQVTVTDGNGVGGNPTFSLPQNIDTAAAVQFGRLGLGASAPGTAGMYAATAGANNITLMALKRNTDSSPTGNFFTLQDAAGGTLWNIDITGSLSAGTIPGARVSGNIAGNAGGLSSTLAVAGGGTGQGSLTNHGVLVGAGTSPVTQLAAAAAGTVLAGQGASSDPSFSATPTLGIAGTTLGTFSLAGNTSGVVTIQPQAAAGTYNFNLPTTAGSSGTVLTSGGGTTNPMTWTTLAASATTDTTSASNISAGTLAVARGGTGTGSTLSGIMRGGNPMTAAELSGDVTTSGSTAATVATKLRTRTCMIPVGRDGDAALTDADLGPLYEQCRADVAMTVTEIAVKADSGTPSVIVHRRTGTTNTALLSSALATGASGAVACAKTTAVTGLDGATTCSATLQNTSVPAGHWIGLTSGTAGGVAKRLSVAITFTVD